MTGNLLATFRTYDNGDIKSGGLALCCFTLPFI
jgi:hypothetical protein